MKVRVEAPARLHLGMFDLAGSLGRRFGGIGLAISRPAIRLSARRSDALAASGADAERALEFARRYLGARGISGGAQLQIEAAIPGHVGLGSGTKLALAVARALAALYDQPQDAFSLAQDVGRGQRSAIGLYTFAQGGLVLEGGRKLGAERPAPALARYALPARWRCLLAIPKGPAGLHGKAELRAFEQLDPDPALAPAIAHQVLMALLPALVEADIAEFGRALSAIQRLVGQSFSPAQGGVFAGPSGELIDALLRAGAAGAGQSSWGPAVYAFAEGEAQARRLLCAAQESLAGQGTAEIVSFDNQGVSVARLEA